VSALPPLPPQPPGVAWPTRRWEPARLASEVDRGAVERALERALAEPGSRAAGEPTGETYALLAVHRGRLVAERYAAGHGPETPLPSWSVAKSITHALVGIALRSGKLDPGAPAPVAAWQEAGDPRRAITLEHLLRMCDGLDFVEDYVDAGVSHVIEMLFGAGRDDVAAYAAARPLAHAPGRVFSYSSGTTNLIARMVGDAVGGGRAAMESFMRRELFDRIGMQSADPRFDAAGTFIGSSFVFATPRDFARFGLLYLRDGVWEGERVLPAGWVDHARTPTAVSLGEYGAHWWLAQDGSGRFSANGYRGQYVVVDPARDLVVVRLGGSAPEQRPAVLRLLAELVHAFPVLASNGNGGGVA
jgi:CubicO group peptidase (beta-lactamase class C family)